MSKNNIIGLLIVIIAIVGGYFLFRSPMVVAPVTEPVTQSTSTTKTPISTTSTSSTAGTPTIETNKNTSTSNATAVVTGIVNPNGASTTYWFEYGTTKAFGMQTTSQAIGSGFASIATPAYITGLHSNTLYYFRLSAKNRFATVNGEMYTFQTNFNPPPQGAAPTVKTGSATSVSRNTAVVNGQINPNGSDTKYWFEYGFDSNLGNVTAIQSSGSNATANPVALTLAGLSPLTQYYFRLNAQNQYGTVNGAVFNFTTPGPANPSSPKVVTDPTINTRSSSTTLVGHINPNGAETTYWFEYSKDSLLSSLIGTGTSEQVLKSGTTNVKVQVNLSKLQADTTYFYHLVGKNAFGMVSGETISFKTKK